MEEPQATRPDMAEDGVIAWVPIWELVWWRMRSSALQREDSQ